MTLPHTPFLHTHCSPLTLLTPLTRPSSQGCLTALNNIVQDNLLIVASVAIAFLVGEVSDPAMTCTGT